MTDVYYTGNNDIVEEIKSRCNIVDVIGRVVTLKKAGSTYKGLCPFHNEKTPSFVVYEKTQTYKCFGCGIGGDLINFVQKYYNLDFMDAIKMLAKEYSIDIDFASNASNKNREFYEINRKAAIFFYKTLREKENPGYLYMRERGISNETLKAFGIGYADSEWTSLVDYMKTQDVNPEKLVDVGLASKKNGRYYDKFRGRVMFPIQNTSDKVIGFGGRIVGEGTPKYLNSSDSLAFKKGNNLYALNITKNYVHSDESIILVEGYMDVISLYQAGIRNVSASLGTALTENQAKLIKRYTSNVLLSYDADSAGQNATLRGLDILYRENCICKVVVVNDGKDPDEFIKANGKEAFIELCKNAVPYGDYKFARLKGKYDISDDQQKIEYLRAAVDILKEMKPIEADIYISKISKDTGISQMAIRKEYEESIIEGHSLTSGHRLQREEKDANAGITEGEQELLKLMLISKKYVNIPKDISEDVFRDQMGQSIYNTIKNTDTGERPLNMDKLNDRLDIDAMEMLKKIDSKIIPPDKEEKIFNDCIKHIRIKKLQQEDMDITMTLRYSSESLAEEDIRKLMKRQIEIQKTLKGQAQQ